MKHVITGGPGIGKTTVLESLASQGYEIVPEVARAIIEEEQQNENGILPWTDLYQFQIKVTDRQLALEQAIRNPHAFCARGLFDNIGYCRESNTNIPPCLQEHCSSTRYGRIFLLDPLADYIKDPQRLEDVEKARR